MAFYKNIDIQVNVGGSKYHAVNLICDVIRNDIPLHRHGINCYEIHYISSGYGMLNVDGNDYRIVPNTLFVTGPLVTHAQITDTNDPMSEWCVYLRIDDSEKESNSDINLKFLSKKFWIGEDEQNILPHFQKLFWEMENRLDGYLEVAGLLISEIIISIARNYIKKSPLTEETFVGLSERTSIIIEEYFLYEYRTANLNELSRRLGLSKRQTQRVIEKYYGSTFSKKKNEAKMSAAILLLSDDSINLDDITELLGYSSREHFIAAFKKYYKTSPGKYRKNKSPKI